jgi:hypothetical protein
MKRLILPVVGLLVALAAYFFYSVNKTPYKNESDPLTSSSQVVKNSNSIIKPSDEGSMHAVTANQFTLYGSKNYAALKAYYEPLAKNGNPYANRVIAQIYDYCATYSSPSYHFNETIDAMIKQKPENKVRLEIIRKEKNERCSTLDNGLPITKELIDFSWAQASSAKDTLATLKLAAEMQIKTPEKAPQGKELDLMIERVINEGDPEAIFAAGELLGLNDSSIDYADVSGPVNQYAWQIAACRVGGARTCGQSSRLMTTLCLGLGDCTSSGFEAMARNSIAPSQTESLNQAISRIEQLLQQRKPKT